jgi:hypothetical protein
MTKRKTSKEKSAKQDNVVDLNPDRFTYDVAQIEDFLDMVFHAKDPDAGNVLTWFSKGRPGYPISEDDLSKRMSRAGMGVAMYFGTSTTDRDPKDDRLYNRKALFRSFHVLVLDDIGTKVPFDKIPKTFEPTYRIESSEGNWQYGYVLEEPITDEVQATALVQLAYDSGLSDAGGKMATKLVRLPGGINGKAGDGQNFKVRLADMDGPFWTPDDILDEIDAGVTWAAVVDDADTVMKLRAAQTVGTSAWSPIKPESPSLAGIIDPALEWLYDMDMVKQEKSDWVDILCPWHDSHTTGELTAGYSPMGWGESPYTNHRIFHCFHEHCQQWTNQDFLKHIVANGGPELPVTERAADLVKRYGLYSVKDGVFDVMAYNPYFIPMAVFKNLHPEKTYIEGVDKNAKPVTKLVAETQLFITSKARMTIRERVYEPTTPARIIQTPDGNLLNTYVPPKWGDGDYDQDDVDRFAAYIKYLVPDEEAREFFLDWLAAKCQDMAFRGPAILMIATRQGAGRTTLGNMITTMLGGTNVVKKPFADLVKGGKFNSWMMTSMVITDETLALQNKNDYFKVAEILKERIDTTPTPMSVELKGLDSYTQMNYTSFLMFSNHADAIRLGENDRRFYVIDNPEKPAKAEYFVALNQWIENDRWAKSVFRWLRQRDVDVGALLKPPEITKAKYEMFEASKQALDVTIETILRLWPSNLISQSQVSAVMAYHGLEYRLGIDVTKIKYALRKELRQHVMRLNTAEGAASRFAAGGIAGVALWVPRCKDTDDIMDRFVTNHATREDIDAERAKMPETDAELGAIALGVIEELDQRDL